MAQQFQARIYVSAVRWLGDNLPELEQIIGSHYEIVPGDPSVLIIQPVDAGGGSLSKARVAVGDWVYRDAEGGTWAKTNQQMLTDYDPVLSSSPAESFKIKAHVISDDHRHRVDFDAAPWFEQASLADIDALIACGFRNDYAADEVALYFEHIHPEMGKFISYVYAAHDLDADTGFECVIDVDDARKWLKKKYPLLTLLSTSS